MDIVKNIVIGALAVLAIVFGVDSFKSPAVVGSGSGQNHSFQEFFDGGIVSGGKVFATSTVNSAETLLASNIDDEIGIDYTLNLQAATLTLPASTTISFLPNAGDTKTLYIRNASTTANTLTIAGGTGMLLKKATSTVAVIGDTDGANYAKIDFTRKANRDIEALLNIFMD